MDFTPRKDWVDTILNVENNGALIISGFKPFQIGGAPTIFAGPGWSRGGTDKKSRLDRFYDHSVDTIKISPS